MTAKETDLLLCYENSELMDYFKDMHGGHLFKVLFRLCTCILHTIYRRISKPLTQGVPFKEKGKLH
jgi:hypothetical protein